MARLRPDLTGQQSISQCHGPVEAAGDDFRRIEEVQFTGFGRQGDETLPDRKIIGEFNPVAAAVFTLKFEGTGRDTHHRMELGVARVLGETDRVGLMTGRENPAKFERRMRQLRLRPNGAGNSQENDNRSNAS